MTSSKECGDYVYDNHNYCNPKDRLQKTFTLCRNDGTRCRPSKRHLDEYGKDPVCSRDGDRSILSTL